MRTSFLITLIACLLIIPTIAAVGPTPPSGLADGDGQGEQLPNALPNAPEVPVNATPTRPTPVAANLVEATDAALTRAELDRASVAARIEAVGAMGAAPDALTSAIAEAVREGDYSRAVELAQNSIFSVRYFCGSYYFDWIVELPAPMKCSTTRGYYEVIQWLHVEVLVPGALYGFSAAFHSMSMYGTIFHSDDYKIGVSYLSFVGGYDTVVADERATELIVRYSLSGIERGSFVVQSIGTRAVEHVYFSRGNQLHPSLTDSYGVDATVPRRYMTFSASGEFEFTDAVTEVDMRVSPTPEQVWFYATASLEATIHATGVQNQIGYQFRSSESESHEDYNLRLNGFADDSTLEGWFITNEGETSITFNGEDLSESIGLHIRRGGGFQVTLFGGSPGIGQVHIQGWVPDFAIRYNAGNLRHAFLKYTPDDVVTHWAGYTGWTGSRIEADPEFLNYWGIQLTSLKSIHYRDAWTGAYKGAAEPCIVAGCSTQALDPGKCDDVWSTLYLVRFWFCRA